MPIQRSTLKSGPAIVIYDGAVLYFKNGLKITEVKETFELKVDAFGKVTERVKNISATLEGVPAGEWEHLSVLFAWLASPIGTRLHGDTDKPALVHFLDGTRYTYHNVALPQMPTLTFKATETLIGSVRFICRCKDNTEPSAANSLYTRDSATFSNADFSLANVKTQRYTLAWGSSPWNSFYTSDGVVVEFPTQWTPMEIDGYGIVDEELVDIGVMARFKPHGVSQADIDAKLALQGNANAMVGADLSANSAAFVLSGSGVYVALTAAAAKQGEQQAGTGVHRTGEMLAVATRTFAEGLPQPLAYVGTSAPG